MQDTCKLHTFTVIKLLINCLLTNKNTYDAVHDALSFRASLQETLLLSRALPW